jgi:hypothetical protein
MDLVVRNKSFEFILFENRPKLQNTFTLLPFQLNNHVISVACYNVGQHCETARTGASINRDGCLRTERQRSPAATYYTLPAGQAPRR